MKGRFLAKVLAVAMLVTSLGTPGIYSAEISDADLVKDVDISDYREHLNYRDESEMKFDFSMSGEEAEHPRNWGTLPKSYSSSAYVDWEFEVQKNYVTPVKNQNPYGTCWAHSTISAVESSYIINEKIADVESVDWNEYHLIHYTYDTPTDPLGLYGGDRTYLPNGSSFLEVGGSNEITGSILANWIGASASTEFTADNVQKDNPDAFGYDAAGHLEDAYYLAMPDMYASDYQTDMSTIKNIIMTYGSVAVSYFSDSLGGSEFDGYYYYPNETGTNHAITIVGWDDSIPASAFKEHTGNTPKGNGAWLVKNSWGNYGSFGGYFWLSYYDRSIAEDAYAYNVVSADNYDNNYQYDGSTSTSYTGYADKSVFANAFVADSAETLEAVGFYTYDTYMDYEIRVYKNLESGEAPQYGELALTQSGSTIYAGYHTIELNNAVDIAKDERYAVVVTLEKEGEAVYVCIDKTSSWGWVSFESYAKEGESYLGYSVGSLSDLNEGIRNYTDGVNVKLKAYTNEGTVKDDDELPTENPFTDVPEHEYYYAPVLWALDKNITSGLTATQFAPEAACTRGQVVTFLWRAMGCPEPTITENPFTDVPAGEYYYKAVLWAYENGITSGLTATEFAPEVTVTRGQFVTFLHRAEQKPAYTVSNPFADVQKDYYYDAVLWAYENGVTSGLTATQFGPEESCTRGQVVTFLYRALQDK